MLLYWPDVFYIDVPRGTTPDEAVIELSLIFLLHINQIFQNTASQNV